MSSTPLSADQASIHPSFTTQSASNGDVINAVFGILAVLASIFTIWQGRKTWKLWRAHHAHQHAQAELPLDLELGGPPPPYPGPQRNNDTADLPTVNADVGQASPPSPSLAARTQEPSVPSLMFCSRPIPHEVSSTDTEQRGSLSALPGPRHDPSQQVVVLGAGTEEPPHPD